MPQKIIFSTQEEEEEVLMDTAVRTRESISSRFLKQLLPIGMRRKRKSLFLETTFTSHKSGRQKETI